jgi:tetratricopeptide (TPR) repeat protein/tRNA A-37 threonylcarbamoyl transferase component Bud32
VSADPTGASAGDSAASSSQPAHWEEIFDRLVELPEPERARLLAELRAENPALAARLDLLLAADAGTTGILDQPTLVLLDAEADGDAVEPQLPPGTTIGPWRVIRLLGRGGMGEVYLAERTEPAFDQRVALKVISRGMDSRAIVRRFVQERQILAHLDHPNLARLLDGGSGPDGRPYLVMEYVDGEPINDYCEHRGLDLEGRLRLMLTVCQAVDSAHRRLVVHRDLKPANILVTGDGTVKLLDFGIAKLLGGDEGAGLTVTHVGTRILTPAYAAPEQILGEPVSMATDVYSLGVMLYELITGALPHRREGRALSALAGTLERETVERPSAVLRRPGTELAGQGDRSRLARRVAGDLDLIVLTALHKEPTRRYASAQRLADDLGNFLAGRPVRARHDDFGYRARKFMLRHRLTVAALAAGVAALIVGLGLSLWEAHAARLSAQRADAEAARAERVKSFLIAIFRQSDPEAGDGATLTAGALLERGAASVDKDLKGEPAVQADLLDAMARIETNLGLVAPALAHAEHALALRRATLAASDGRIGLSLVTLGEAQHLVGDGQAAARSFAAALVLLRPAFGADSVEVATALSDFGGSQHRPEDRGRAVDLYRQALAIFDRRLGEGSVESASTLHDLGYAYEVAQRYPEAEAAYRRSAFLLERALGPRSLRVAMVQADLAGLLDRMGKGAGARPIFERAVADLRSGLGPHHPRLADTLFSYSILLIGEQDFEGADKALTEALAIYGPARPETAHCLRYLGISAMGQERYAAAADYFTRAAELFRRLEGEDDVERWRALANLGGAEERGGRIGEGRVRLARAVAQLERLLGRDRYELRLPLEMYGEALTAAGETNHAVEVLQRVKALELKLFGTIEHPEVAESELVLARALLARQAPGDRRLARQVLDETLGIYSRVHPRDRRRGEALLESGRLALAERDRARARADLGAAVELLTALKGPAHADTRAARRLLALAGGLPAAAPQRRQLRASAG